MQRAQTRHVQAELRERQGHVRTHPAQGKEQRAHPRRRGGERGAQDQEDADVAAEVADGGFERTHGSGENFVGLPPADKRNLPADPPFRLAWNRTTTHWTTVESTVPAPSMRRKHGHERVETRIAAQRLPARVQLQRAVTDLQGGIADFGAD